VYVLADFWERHPEVFQLIAANEMIEFIHTQKFSSEESAMYLLGLEKFPAFFKKCYDERQAIEKSKIVLSSQETEKEE